MEYVVAQVNIGRLVAPLDSPEVADFVAGLDPVNAVADSAPGFVWRLQTEDGNATAVRAFEWATAGSGAGTSGAGTSGTGTSGAGTSGTGTSGTGTSGTGTSGTGTSGAGGSDGGIIVNMSVWESVEALAAYVYGQAHIAVLRRRREWFKRMTLAYTALWWIPRGHIPAVTEAEDRVKHLRVHGPTPYAFTLKVHFPPPGAGTGPLRSPEDWACPV